MKDKNDKQILKEMLDRNEIKYSEDNPQNQITIEAGYVGFYSIFTFSEDGSLKSVEAFE